MVGLLGCNANADFASHADENAGPATPRPDATATNADASNGSIHDGIGASDAVPPMDGPCSDVVDIVFVLDLSSSMRFILSALVDDIPRVVDAASALAPEPHFGFVGFTDNHAFAPGNDGPIHTEAASLSAAFSEHVQIYTDADRNPGDGPSGPTQQNPICEENSLDALHAAASMFPWRPNATRVVILATDDTFLQAPDNYGDRNGDGQTNLSDFPREGDYPALHTIRETVDLLQQQRIRVFSFTRVQPPMLLDFLGGVCTTGRRLPWEAITDGWTTPYGDHEPIPEATDGRNYDVAAVRDGQLNLADTISEVVIASYCHPPLI